MRKSSLLLFITLFCLAACSRKPSFPVAHTYMVRGVVVQLPEKGKPGSDFYVSHEAIPDFYNAEGAKEGMSAMTMQFFCSDKERLEGLKVGDKIRMTIIYSKDLTQSDILTVKKLASETVLKTAH